MLRVDLKISRLHRSRSPCTAAADVTCNSAQFFPFPRRTNTQHSDLEPRPQPAAHFQAASPHPPSLPLFPASPSSTRLPTTSPPRARSGWLAACGGKVEGRPPCRDDAAPWRCRRCQRRRRRSGAARRRGRASPSWSPASSRGPSPASSPSVHVDDASCLPVFLIWFLRALVSLTRICGAV